MRRRVAQGLGATVAACQVDWLATQGPMALQKAFNDWHCEWGRAAWRRDAHREAFDWAGFNVNGLALALRLKQLAGPAYKVIYMRLYEEPRQEKVEHILEVRLDGRPRPYEHKPFWSGSAWSRLGFA
jgi:hypothetical protein